MEEPTNTSGCLTFIDSGKGKKILLLNGYRYTLSLNNKSGSSYWRCSMRSICNGSVTLDKDKKVVVKVNIPHICEPDFSKNKVKEHLNLCKEMVKEAYHPIPAIYEYVVEKMAKDKDVDVVDIPDFKSVKDSLYKVRNKELKVPKTTFHKTADVIIPPILAHDFLLCEEILDGEKILIFSSLEARKLVTKQTHFFADGTFYVTPRPYQQLYTIHTVVGTPPSFTMIPVIFCLLPGKTESIYTKLFEILKQKLSMNVTYMKLDYELAAINAIRKCYPEAQVTGCLFHYKKAITKKSKSLSIGDSHEGRKIINLCMSLPLLPSKYITDGWIHILSKAKDIANFNKFQDYFEKQWLKIIRAECLSVANDLHRTTSVLESWHRRIKVRFGSKSNICKFTTLLKKEATHFDIKIRQSKYKIYKTHTNAHKKRFDKKVKSVLRRLSQHIITAAEALVKFTKLTFYFKKKLLS